MSSDQHEYSTLPFLPVSVSPSVSPSYLCPLSLLSSLIQQKRVPFLLLSVTYWSAQSQAGVAPLSAWLLQGTRPLLLSLP